MKASEWVWASRALDVKATAPRCPLFAYDSITVSFAWELTSVSMRYSQGAQVNTSLSRIMYCTHE